MDGSYWAAAIKTKIPLRPQKSAYRRPDLAHFISSQHLTVIMLDCCNFSGVAGFVTHLGRGGGHTHKDICPRLHVNKLTGFQSHCQSLNLCLSIIWMWMSECVFTGGLMLGGRWHTSEVTLINRRRRTRSPGYSEVSSHDPLPHLRLLVPVIGSRTRLLSLLSANERQLFAPRGFIRISRLV